MEEAQENKMATRAEDACALSPFESLPPEIVELVLMALASPRCAPSDIARFALINATTARIVRRAPLPPAVATVFPRRLLCRTSARPTLVDAMDHAKAACKLGLVGADSVVDVVGAAEAARRRVLQAYVRWALSTFVTRKMSLWTRLVLDTGPAGPDAVALEWWARLSGQGLEVRGKPSIFGAELAYATGKDYTMASMPVARRLARSASPVGRPRGGDDGLEPLARLLSGADAELMGTIDVDEASPLFDLDGRSVNGWLAESLLGYGLQPPVSTAARLAQPQSRGLLVDWIDAQVARYVGDDCAGAVFCSDGGGGGALFPRFSDIVQFKDIYLVALEAPFRSECGKLGIIAVHAASGLASTE